MENNFHFEIISSQEFENSIALVLAVTNLPESPELIATNKYNLARNLPLDNEVKWDILQVDPMRLNEAAKNFVENYSKQQGYNNSTVVLDGNWSNSGYDTVFNSAIKTKAWIEFNQAQARTNNKMIVKSNWLQDHFFGNNNNTGVNWQNEISTLETKISRATRSSSPRVLKLSDIKQALSRGDAEEFLAELTREFYERKLIFSPIIDIYSVLRRLSQGDSHVSAYQQVIGEQFCEK